MIIKEHNECWPWISALTHDGFRFRGICYYAHRFIYEYIIGPIYDFHVLHSCDNRACVNPVLGTNLDNVIDRDNKNRVCHGVRHRECRLSEQDVINIREQAYFKTRHQLAKEYGVDPSHITKIVNFQKRKRG